MKHFAYDLKQMQSLPLEAKIKMSEQRIKVWFESWTRFEINNKKTGKTRYTTIDTRKFDATPSLKEHEWIVSYEDGQAYVAFSGGKDSTVLADLCARVCKEYGYTLYLLFVNTGLEYPEIQKFVKDFAEWLRIKYNIKVVLDIVRPEMRFDEVIKKYGYPVISKEVAQVVREAKIGLNRNDGSYKYRIQRITSSGVYTPKNGKKSRYDVSKYQYLLNAPFDASEKCCEVMKKAPSRRYAKESGKKPILGTMASESKLRTQRWLKHGCNAFDATGDNQSSNPISFWLEQDILQYLKFFDVPYCPVYGDIVVRDEDGNTYDISIEFFKELIARINALKLMTTGCNRTGCIFCMFGCHLEKEPNRFQRLKQTHPRQYEYCIGGGQYITEGFAKDDSGEWKSFVFEHHDGTPMSNEEIEEFVEEFEDDADFKFVRKWQPNKEGLGLAKVLDYIGVDYV